MKYVGVWYGGASYVGSSWADHAEVFTSLEHAKSEFEDRYSGYLNSVAVEWNEDGTPRAGDPYSARTPSVGSDQEIFLVPFEYANLDVLQRDGYPDRIVKFGPRGGVIVEKV